MINDKYVIPDGADWNIYINYNNNIKLDSLKEFYKEYNYDIEYDYSFKEEGLSIGIYKIAKEEQGINNEFFNKFSEEDKDELLLNVSNKGIYDVLKKINSLIYINARDKEESILVLIFSLYLSKQIETIVYDTYNGYYLTKDDINKILTDMSLEKNNEEPIEKIDEKQIINMKVNESCELIINSLPLLLDEKKQRKTLKSIEKNMDEIIMCILSNDNVQHVKEVITQCRRFADDNNIIELIEKCRHWQMNIFLRNSNY